MSFKYEIYIFPTDKDGYTNGDPIISGADRLSDVPRNLRLWDEFTTTKACVYKGDSLVCWFFKNDKGVWKRSNS